MKIWIISLYDPTEIDDTRPMRFLSLAQKSAEFQHEVTYFSNTFRHATKKNRFEKQTTVEHSENYKTIFIKSSAYKKNMSLWRLFSHYEYAKNIINFFNNSQEKPDIIVSALPPILTNYKLSKWCLKNKIPYVIDVIDPWPEIFLRIVPKWLHLPFKILMYPFYYQVKFAIKNASGIFSISKQYIFWAEKFKSRKNQINDVFYPSVDLDKYQKEMSKYKRINNSKVRLVYAGNLGLSYDIPCILNAAKLLEDNYPGKTEFIFAGLGGHEDLIKSYQKDYKNIDYLGRIGHTELLELYASSDIGLAQYSEGATQSITYKFFDYLGAGLPILNSLQSEMSELIEKNDLGLNNLPGDFNKLAENIVQLFDNDLLNLYRKNAINFTSKFGDNKIVYKNYIETLQQILT
ncbi:MAG: glycosyltransferase family 4 protein [Bacteroidia bacterium]